MSAFLAITTVVRLRLRLRRWIRPGSPNDDPVTVLSAAAPGALIAAPRRAGASTRPSTTSPVAGAGDRRVHQ
ncbi:hypothetical protein ACFVVU_09395 [Kitasatospora sp. NPDC057965]|uniref:hypothetical protein n=1 Tax=Kitasatospora sp. NPDC057965 TaxID=3346291 RepID=UPI0036D8BCB1